MPLPADSVSDIIGTSKGSISFAKLLLKEHKNDNLLGTDFEFCTVSWLVMLNYKGFVKKIDLAIIWGGTIVPRSLKTKGNKKCFKLGPYFFLLKHKFIKTHALIGKLQYALKNSPNSIHEEGDYNIST